MCQLDKVPEHSPAEYANSIQLNQGQKEHQLLVEIPHQALRTSIQQEQGETPTPCWKEMEDKVMSVEEAVDKVQTWLDCSILPQDKIITQHGVVKREALQGQYEKQKERRAQQDWHEEREGGDHRQQ